jgi:hypothetical protein
MGPDPSCTKTVPGMTLSYVGQAGSLRRVGNPPCGMVRRGVGAGIEDQRTKELEAQ